ncbi:MAG TPA: 50S ribosomal protein L18 [Candidatus Limnocylindrales bacterium]|nr:50S ribosomal protein L18 [Candidatus Limnocylindrales bacterium]
MYKTPDRRAARVKRHVRVRTKVRGASTRPRLSIFRSVHHLYAQVIDDSVGRTLVAASSVEPDLRKAASSTSGAAAAAAVGKSIAERARQRGIEVVVFDRGGFPYHGRIKAAAEAARAAGLKF